MRPFGKRLLAISLVILLTGDFAYAGPGGHRGRGGARRPVTCAAHRSSVPVINKHSSTCNNGALAVGAASEDLDFLRAATERAKSQGISVPSSDSAQELERAKAMLKSAEALHRDISNKAGAREKSLSSAAAKNKSVISELAAERDKLNTEIKRLDEKIAQINSDYQGYMWEYTQYKNAYEQNGLRSDDQVQKYFEIKKLQEDRVAEANELTRVKRMLDAKRSPLSAAIDENTKIVEGAQKIVPSLKEIRSDNEAAAQKLAGMLGNFKSDLSSATGMESLKKKDDLVESGISGKKEEDEFSGYTRAAIANDGKKAVEEGKIIPADASKLGSNSAVALAVSEQRALDAMGESKLRENVAELGGVDGVKTKYTEVLKDLDTKNKAFPESGIYLPTVSEEAAEIERAKSAVTDYNAAYDKAAADPAIKKLLVEDGIRRLDPEAAVSTVADRHGVGETVVMPKTGDIGSALEKTSEPGYAAKLTETFASTEKLGAETNTAREANLAATKAEPSWFDRYVAEPLGMNTSAKIAENDIYAEGPYAAGVVTAVKPEAKDAVQGALDQASSRDVAAGVVGTVLPGMDSLEARKWETQMQGYHTQAGFDESSKQLLESAKDDKNFADKMAIVDVATFGVGGKVKAVAKAGEGLGTTVTGVRKAEGVVDDLAAPSRSLGITEPVRTSTVVKADESASVLRKVPTETQVTPAFTPEKLTPIKAANDNALSAANDNFRVAAEKQVAAGGDSLVRRAAPAAAETKIAASSSRIAESVLPLKTTEVMEPVKASTAKAIPVDETARAAAEAKRLEAAAKAKSQSDWAAQSEANALRRQNEAAMARAEAAQAKAQADQANALIEKRAGAENMRVARQVEADRAATAKAQSEAIQRQQAANIQNFQTKLNTDVPLAYPKAAPEFKAVPEQKIAGGDSLVRRQEAIATTKVDEAAAARADAQAAAIEDRRTRALASQSRAEAAARQAELDTQKAAQTKAAAETARLEAAAKAKSQADWAAQSEANALKRQSEATAARAEAKASARAAANENVRTRALASQSQAEALKRQQAANIKNFQTQLNDNTPLSYPAAVPEQLRAAARPMPQPPVKTINAETVPELLAKNNISHTPIDHRRALVTPGPENKVSRTSAYVEKKYDTKTFVDESVDDANFGGWANKEELTLSRHAVTNKADQGPLLSHEVEHVKNTSAMARRVDEGQTAFDWRNITFGSPTKPTGIHQYDQMAIDEVMAYRRSYNQYRFDTNKAAVDGDHVAAFRSEVGSEAAAYQYGEKLRASTSYLRSADESLGKMAPSKLVSQQTTVATSELPLGAPPRVAGVKSVTVKKISDGSGGSMHLVKTRYGDNKEFTNMVVSVRGNNGNTVPMTMPVPNSMMNLPEKVALSNAKGYVGEAIGKMDNYEILYQQSAARKANLYATYKNKPAIPEAANPGVVGGDSNPRILPDLRPKSTRGGQLEKLGIERAAEDGRAPAARFDDPNLIGQRAEALKGEFTPKTLQEMADRRVNWVLKEHSEFSAITAADNRKFMDFAARAERGEAKESFFVTENAVLKRLNDDVVKDKDFVTALDNLHKDVLLREIQKDPVLKDAVVASYNDYKSIGFALKKNDAQIRRLLDEKIAKTNQGFDDFLKKVETAKGWKEKSIGLASDMRTWHHSGIGKTFQEAGLAARRSRELALESGEARLVNFADESAHYIAATDRMAARSTDLGKKFKSSAMLEKAPHGTALSEEAIETIRKAKPLGKSEEDMNKAVSAALKKRYQQDVSLEDAALLRAQLKDIDSVNPSLLIERRVEINMGLHDEGVVSFDFKGQNSRNLYQTQLAILKSRGKDMKTRLEAIAEGDRIATAQLDDMKARVEKAVSSLGEKYVGKDVSKVVQKSGDDGIFHPLKELGPAEKAKLAKALNEQKVGDAVRLTYLPKNYRNSKEMIKTVDRNRLVVEAEKIEKDLFTEHLVGELPDDVFKGLQVKVDLVPAQKGKSAVGLTFAHASGKQIPAKAEEIARRVLDKKYDIAYVDRPGVSAGRAPAAASKVSAAANSSKKAYSPLDIGNEVESSRVFATTQEWETTLKKMGVGTTKTNFEPVLRQTEKYKWYGSNLKVKPMTHPNGAGQPYYGQVFKVSTLPKASAKGSPLSSALTHPEMAFYLQEMKKRGYELVIDSSQGFVGMGAYFSPSQHVISLAPHSNWSTFLHEFQHLEFYDTIKKFGGFNGLKNMRVLDNKDLVADLPQNLVRQIGAEKLKKIQALLDRGVTTELAVDESLSVGAELRALGWRRYIPGSHGQFTYRYMLRHQITELEGLGSAMTDQQRKLVQANKVKHFLSQKVVDTSPAYAPVAAVGGAYGSYELYSYLASEDAREILYDSQGNMLVVEKNGTLRYLSLKSN